MDTSKAVMELISKSGEAKSLAFEAIYSARNGEFAKSEQKISDSKEASRLAHKIQTALIAADGEDGKLKLSLLMIHAQDHLMDSILAQDIASEFIKLYQKMVNLN